MHRRGVGFGSTVYPPEGDSFSLFEADSWEGVPVDKFPEGLEIPAGTRIEYHCDYENPEARVVWQGPRSTNEMCMLVGAYYPAKPYIADCSINEETAEETRTLGADWVGSGAADCDQSPREGEECGGTEYVSGGPRMGLHQQGRVPVQLLRTV